MDDTWWDASEISSTKSPYFLLPDAKYLLQKNENTVPPSLKRIYGKVEAMSDRKQADFLLRLLAHSKFEPDYGAMARSLGLTNEHFIRQRFQTLCEMNCFRLDNRKVTPTSALPDFDATTLENASTAATADVKTEAKPKRRYTRKTTRGGPKTVKGTTSTKASKPVKAQKQVSASKEKKSSSTPTMKADKTSHLTTTALASRNTSIEEAASATMPDPNMDGTRSVEDTEHQGPDVEVGHASHKHVSADAHDHEAIVLVSHHPDDDTPMEHPETASACDNVAAKDQMNKVLQSFLRAEATHDDECDPLIYNGKVQDEAASATGSVPAED